MAINEYHRLKMHCTENSKQIFPEMKLHGLVPNFHIHISVSEAAQFHFWESLMAPGTTTSDEVCLLVCVC